MPKLIWRASVAARKSWDFCVHRFADAGHLLLPPTWPGRYGVELLADVVYGERAIPEHRLDVYRPRAAEGSLPGPLPALVYVHGGGFTILSRKTHRIFALKLARMGFVVFNLDYRLAPAHRYPVPLLDVARGLSFVLEEAPRFGADPGRLILAGESAGANLATALAYACTHPMEEGPMGEGFARELYERAPALEAVLAYYGIYDVHEVDRLWRRRAKGMPFYVRQELSFIANAYLDPDRPEAPLASPLRLLEGPAGSGTRPLPPFFLAVGTSDPLLDHSRRLAAALRRRSGEAELHIYPGEIHGFNAMLWRRAAKDSWAKSEAFLRRIGGEGGFTRPAS